MYIHAYVCINWLHVTIGVHIEFEFWGWDRKLLNLKIGFDYPIQIFNFKLTVIAIEAISPPSPQLCSFFNALLDILTKKWTCLHFEDIYNCAHVIYMYKQVLKLLYVLND